MPSMPSTNPNDNIAGLVLAGGRSSRMGRDKSQLVFRGQPLIDHMRTVLNNTGLDPVYTSGPDGIVDLKPDYGPLGGLYSAACQLPSDSRVLVVPVDMPLLTPALLNHLIAHSAQAGGYFTDYMFPLLLTLTDAARHQLEAAVTQTVDQRKAPSVRSLLAALALPSISLPLQWQDQLANINTPADWQVIAKLQT